MNTTDFVKGEFNAFSGKTTVWGREAVEIYVNFTDDAKGCEDEYLAINIALINNKLEWIENNRHLIEQALLDDDMLAMAEDWASSAEEVEDEEQECYIMEDGQKVFLPISEEDFCLSLYFEAINISFDGENPEAELVLLCNPDYFAGHCILATVDAENRVECNSLAG